MGAAEALRNMVVAALVVVALAIVCAEVLHGRDDRRYAEELRECEQVAKTRAAVLRADIERTRALNDGAFEAAEREFRQAARKLPMPSREQLYADVSSATGEHDRIEDIPAIELLTFAAIVDGLRERPAAPADSEQAGGPFQW